jgi:predicted AAA+ superfamily ATPase
MYRSSINKLVQWKLNKKRKPLVLLGARQVGKTWLLQEFGRAEYKQMVYVNFEDTSAPKMIFQDDFDIDRIITVLNAYANLKITPEDTLLVFDEIQAVPQGITILKYFYEKAAQYHVIAAGSLLGINLHPNESFPVGKVEFLSLYPFGFNEFLLAMGENGLVELIETRKWDLLTTFHAKLVNYLRYYFYVGGMPEAVLSFVQERDWLKVRNIQKNILLSYQMDFSKHAPKEIVPRINMVWKSLPSQLAKENKKFIYSVIKEGARAKDYELAIEWLVNAGLLLKCYSVKKPNLPLVAYQNLSAFKLFHNDVGLLGAMSSLSARTIVEGNAIFTEYKGALTEQYVIQQLLLNGDLDIFYFPFDDSKYEIDFIVQHGDDVIPIEVKAGENLRARSFNFFCEKFQSTMAIRTSLSKYRRESWMTNVPLYVVGNYLN